MKLDKYSKWVRRWLIAGCILLFFQVVIGGITRITGSGLSITKWEIVTGTLPPLNKADWQVEFDLYKATPQYEKINRDFGLSDFKFIYFWEYFHRLWARIMGLVFLFPFLFFLIRKMIDKRIIIHLGFVIFFAMLAAVFGWIMVASGLVDRPWVNAYKLTLHLGIALTTMGFLYWTTFISYNPNGKKLNSYPRLKYFAKWITAVLCLQIFLGGIMSGLRAGLVFPTWPDINGTFIPSYVLDPSNWSLQHFIDYDKSPFVPALFHFLHRSVAYLLFVLSILYVRGILKEVSQEVIRKAAYLFIGLICFQVVIGILTVINCKGVIPVFYGVMHQATAILLLGSALFLNFKFTYNE